MKVGLYSKVYSQKDVLSVSHCSSHEIHCSVRTKVRLQPMTENSNETRTRTFLPSVWAAINQRSLHQSSLLEAQTSPELHRSLRLFLPNSPFNLFLNGSQTCMVVSKLSEPPFAPILPSQVITLNKFLVILTPSWSQLPGWLPHASWIDTLLPTTADLLFVSGDKICVFYDCSMCSFLHGFFHSAWQFEDSSILLKLSGANCIFIAK